MNIKFDNKICIVFFFNIIFKWLCYWKMGKSKPFKHNTPLIKDDIQKVQEKSRS